MFCLDKRRGKGTHKRSREAKKHHQTKQENQQTNMIWSTADWLAQLVKFQTSEGDAGIRFQAVLSLRVLK